MNRKERHRTYVMPRDATNQVIPCLANQCCLCEIIPFPETQATHVEWHVIVRPSGYAYVRFDRIATDKK